MLQEICLLRVLSFDANMVQFYGACLDPGFPMLILEYMEGGDLLTCIQHDCYPRVVGNFRWYKKGGRVALDVAKGLVFLHEQKVSTCSLRQLVYPGVGHRHSTTQQLAVVWPQGCCPA